MMKMFSCKEISKIYSEERPMTFLERINFKLHVFICHNCKHYFEKMKLIQDKLEQIIKKRVNQASVEQMESLKEEIKRKCL